MIKHIAFAFLFFAVSISFAQELTATQKLPATVDPNSEFTVEITINRGQINGFMKFFQPLPEGFTATEIDSKGGSFTFAENGAKIVWIAPPGELNYTISYKVKVPATASGTKTLGAKLSYIFNNERKAFDFENKTITIGSDAAVVKTETPKTVTPKTEVTKTETPKTNTSTQPVIIVKTETAKTEVPKTTSSGQPAETKKETTSATKSTTLPLSSKTPVTAIPSSPGKTFRVQIGAFNLKPKITGVPEHSTIILDNGMTKHFSGNFSSYEDAVKRKKQMIDKGYNGAFIVSFENGKIVK